VAFSRTTRIGVAVALGAAALVAGAGAASADPVVPIPDVAPTLSSDQHDEDAPTPADEAPEAEDGTSKDDITPGGVPVQGTADSVQKAPKGITPKGDTGGDSTDDQNSEGY
jgi:hypothetical protein